MLASACKVTTCTLYKITQAARVGCKDSVVMRWHGVDPGAPRGRRGSCRGRCPRHLRHCAPSAPVHVGVAYTISCDKILWLRTRKNSTGIRTKSPCSGYSTCGKSSARKGRHAGWHNRPPAALPLALPPVTSPGSQEGSLLLWEGQRCFSNWGAHCHPRHAKPSGLCPPKFLTPWSVFTTSEGVKV